MVFVVGGGGCDLGVVDRVVGDDWSDGASIGGGDYCCCCC